MSFIPAKKSLGQNFLKAPWAIDLIIEKSAVIAGDTVLEVGPGKGVLTEALLATGAKVFAIEKDTRMISLLQEKFFKEIEDGRLILIEGDAITSDIPGLGSFERYKVVANIPYYITGIFLRKFLSLPKQPSSMTIMIQKEVADRIVARDGKESILSISVKFYGTPKYIKTVPAGCFEPAPSVDSAILLIENIGRHHQQGEEKFFKILKKGFAHKRKILLQNLDLSLEQKNLVVEKMKIDPKIRAEDLKLEEWLELCLLV